MSTYKTVVLLSALVLIRGYGCENYIPLQYGTCTINRPDGRGAKYEADAWCDSCIADHAIQIYTNQQRDSLTGEPE